MAHLYGREWTRANLLRHVGDLAQVARIQPVRLAGGRGDGMAALEVDVGDGLRFTVLPSRCLDIAHCAYRGVPLAWISRNGLVAPAYYEPEGDQWLRSFFGGLLTTCGLRNAGPACDYAGERHGLHGRIGNTPAEDVSAGGEWLDDEYELHISGVMRETHVFNEDLRLIRRMTTRLGGRSIQIHNRVENRGDQRVPLMILFHINAGFPLLAAESRLIAPDRAVAARDARATEGLADHARMAPPQAGFAEQVYFHDVRADAAGWARIAVVNEALELPFGRGLGLSVSWRRDQLWNLIEWKQLGTGDYVLGTEPANNRAEGVAAAAQDGTLEFIEPGEARAFDLELAVLVGQEEIATFEAALPESLPA